MATARLVYVGKQPGGHQGFRVIRMARAKPSPSECEHARLPRTQVADACFAREATEDAGRRCGAAWSDGEGRNRTGDTTIFSRVLYQLSYLAKAV